MGDTLDFWRVEAYEQDRLLRLSAEMKTPGRIWLQFEVDGDQAGTTLRQTAIFEGMLRRIGEAAIASARSPVTADCNDRVLLGDTT